MYGTFTVNTCTLYVQLYMRQYNTFIKIYLTNSRHFVKFLEKFKWFVSYIIITDMFVNCTFSISIKHTYQYNVGRSRHSEYFLRDADAMSSLCSVSFFPDRWLCFSCSFLGKRAKISCYNKQMLQKELFLKLFSQQLHLFWIIFLSQSCTQIYNNRTHSFFIHCYVHVPQTERTILSPFTKEFRVWGAPIELISIY
jgi:hypothetical protein